MKFSFIKIAICLTIFIAQITALSLANQAKVEELSTLLQTAEEADRANMIIKESDLSGAEMNK